MCWFFSLAAVGLLAGCYNLTLAPYTGGSGGQDAGASSGNPGSGGNTAAGGGSGGNVSSAGTGSGGCQATTSEPKCATTVGTGSPGLIDDFSNGDASILPNDGRKGFWTTYNDGTGSQTPAAFLATCTLAVPSGGKICTSGSGFQQYAGIGFYLNGGLDCIGLYDASAYAGVTFTVSGTVQSGNFRFNIATAPTQSVEYDGTCTSGCEDHYGVNLTLVATPQTFTYYFSQLHQQGWGTPVDWNLAQAEMQALNWEIYVTDNSFGVSTGIASFADICISYVAFF
jgi:hypothetical protein